jgi:hypothetical protein
MTTEPLLPGGSVRVRMDSDGVWHATEHRPHEQPTADEHKAFTDNGYYRLSRIELMRRLRAAEREADEPSTT